MNYEIIKDEKILRDFIDWLPELDSHEKYYLCLFARSKYCKNENGDNTLPHIKTDKAQLKRFVSDKDRMFDKIKQLECELGAYKQKDLIVPQEALALYITPNPRDMFKATVNTMVKLAQSIRDQNVIMNPHQEALSEIQKAKSRNCFVDFDIDFKGPNLGGGDYLPYMTDWFYDRIGYSANMEILETRGGYHVLIDPNTIEKEFKKSWYKAVSQNQYIDQVGDLMIPVPGCTQGNFIPKFIK